MKLGLIDFGVRSSDIGSLAIIQDLIDYAVAADQLGYTRFWLAEHHNFDPLAAWLNPEVLIPIIAGATDQIRVGAGGILLSNHSPYRVAYTFKLLNNLYADRIDLGVAKGYTNRQVNGVDNTAQFHNTETKEQREWQLKENTTALLNYLYNEDDLLKEEIVIPPFKGSLPALWSLTGSYRNLETLARQGMNVSRSLFHFGSDIAYHKEQLAAYRELFLALNGRLPQVSIAFSGACSRDGAQARKTFENYKYGFTPDNIVGCPSLFQDRLSAYQEDYGIDEFVFMNVALSPADRLEGITLIADKMKL